MRLPVLIACIAACACLTLTGAVASPYFQALPVAAAPGESARLMAKARKGLPLSGDTPALQQLLAADRVDLELPLPNGDTVIYSMEYSPVAEPGFVAQFPQIRTFRGTDVNNPGNRGRFDISPAGFRGMFRHNGRTVFIDPRYRHATSTYLSYYAADALPLEPYPGDTLLQRDSLADSHHLLPELVARGSSDGILRSYRLAVAATAEYTAFFGGVDGAAAAITTTINRINQIYENELNITLQLVANNRDIIYTDSTTDGYANNSSLADLMVNQENLDAVIGSANYDIGHLLSTGPGGLAFLSSVCDNTLKAQGVTGSLFPIGDRFYAGFVAHEIGHQFGANHTFNGTADACGGGNRNAATAYEPGSGSTIMAYAGICGSQNLQPRSDSYFHAGSIAEITAFVTNGATGGRCATTAATVNNIPSADAGADTIIPAATPFILTGSATDVDPGDTLTYSWEQLDTGAASTGPATMVDDGGRTLFRSFPPASSPTRYLPRLEDLVAGTTTLGEAYPVTSRTLQFRLTVRDNSGATAFDDKRITVTARAGPFLVTQPEVATEWSSAGSEEVQWSVANTDVAPVSCSQVDILLSTDDGATFGTELILATPNDGSEMVTVPDGISGRVKVMVKCLDNRFFAVNNDVLPPPVQPPAEENPDDGGSGGDSVDGGGGGSMGAVMTLMLFLLVLLRLFANKK